MNDWKDKLPLEQRLRKLAHPVADEAIVELDQKARLLDRCLSYFADLNGSAWIPGDAPGPVDMRNRAKALQKLLFESK